MWQQISEIISCWKRLSEWPPDCRFISCVQYSGDLTNIWALWDGDFPADPCSGLFRWLCFSTEVADAFSLRSFPMSWGKNGFSEWNPEFLLLFLWRDATFCLLSLQKVSSTVIRGCAGENDIRAGDLSGGINTFKQAFLRGGVVFIPKRLPQTDGVLRC